MKLLSTETLKLGLNNIRLHKLRSLLTSLGTIFGVAAVICMLSISEGASADEMRMIALLGTRNIIVNSVKPQQSSNVSQGQTNLLDYGIKRTDVDIIRATVPGLEHLVPLKSVGYEIARGEYRMDANVVGTVPEFFDVVNVQVSRGRPITPVDAQSKTKVCVIGQDVYRELFGFDDPIGQTIQVSRMPASVPFTVVGVLGNVDTAGAPRRGVQERNINREVFVPLATAESYFGDMRIRRQAGSREITQVEYSGLYVAVQELDDVMAVSEVVRRVFEHSHAELDYEIRVPLRALKVAQKKARNSKIMLGSIAGISLIVGGIGIMNIMLATVTERTREIGIRRALGARQAHITVQFLVETVTLTTIGGLVGVFLGVTSAYSVNYLANWQTIVSAWSVALSFLLSVGVGVCSGLYPAMRAAKLDPIEALRYE
jgi:putative ABC transport system permease protein